MAQKYNKYGAGHKNANKITPDDINPLHRASLNGMGNQECYDKGYTFISGKIDKQGVCLWADPQQINKEVKKYDNIDEDILKMLLFAKIQQGKALADIDFYIIGFAICGRPLDNKNSFCLEVDTKKMTITLSIMKQTLENINEYQTYLTKNQIAIKV